MTFTIDKDTLASFRRAEVRTMSEDEAGELMDKYGLFYIDNPEQHGLDSIVRPARPGWTERYFASKVFRHLRFGDDLE